MLEEGPARSAVVGWPQFLAGLKDGFGPITILSRRLRWCRCVVLPFATSCHYSTLGSGSLAATPRPKRTPTGCAAYHILSWREIHQPVPDTPPRHGCREVLYLGCATSEFWDCLGSDDGW